MSKLLTRNICIVNTVELERTDYVSDVLDPWVLIKKGDAGKYMLYTGTMTVSEAIEQELAQKGVFKDLALKKKMEVKKLIKIVGNDGFVGKY